MDACTPATVPVIRCVGCGTPSDHLTAVSVNRANGEGRYRLVVRHLCDACVAFIVRPARP